MDISNVAYIDISALFDFAPNSQFPPWYRALSFVELALLDDKDSKYTASRMIFTDVGTVKKGKCHEWLDLIYAETVKYGVFRDFFVALHLLKEKVWAMPNAKADRLGGFAFSQAESVVLLTRGSLKV
ncbi:hypothetical protein OUZ56_030364 [Daphnia magna]|uniref:PIN domain-containing protein n=1 Tax=Daphnia magna TaxID=35525 RepID=A0ABQ9ZSD7_9CRUS|nr:hypothetical protein OUZ56_030364 [Daphnia magna]